MRIALTVSMTVVLVSPVAGAESPVPWLNADAHVGKIVLIEGFVREAQREGRRVTLLFDPDDPRALRVTLLIPLVTDLPPEPEALYRERRIQVRGRVTRTAGHLDVIVTDPDRITVAGLTSPDQPAAIPDANPAVPAGTPLSKPGTTVPRAAPAPTVPARPSPRADAATRAAAACARLTAARDTARREALDAVARLRACLESGRPGCVSEADAIASPVTRLEWIEQELGARCPANP